VTIDVAVSVGHPSPLIVKVPTPAAYIFHKGLVFRRRKPKTPCSKCTNQLYAALDDHVIENHLRGSIIAGIYPMLPDET
jgi:hypothetical protein